jgi:hypothetical protein
MVTGTGLGFGNTALKRDGLGLPANGTDLKGEMKGAKASSQERTGPGIEGRRLFL